MNRIKKYGFVTVLLLNACALSPQVINIAPVLNTTGINAHQSSRPISITVNDTRTRAVIGSRGGVYSDTALLTTAENMNNNIRDSLASALSELGYVISTGNTATSLTVNISELLYSSVKNNALTNISTSATVNVSCRNANNTLNNDYKITNKKDFIKSPSQKENERIINDTLASSLDRIFHDTKLLACLDA